MEACTELIVVGFFVNGLYYLLTELWRNITMDGTFLLLMAIAKSKITSYSINGTLDSFSKI